ncbi:MAG: acyl-CoA thioesterase, partial [Lachnospiraceae bacterium]|nr:acyl-CoA thioesterase [Lachnospiraceae bacterium]
VQEFKGVKLHLAYEMRDAAGKVVCTGTTSHAFFNLEGRPLRMKQEYPDLYEVFMGELEK